MALLLYGTALSIWFLSKGPELQDNWQCCQSTRSSGRTHAQFRLLTGVVVFWRSGSTGPQSLDAEGEEKGQSAPPLGGEGWTSTWQMHLPTGAALKSLSPSAHLLRPEGPKGRAGMQANGSRTLPPAHRSWIKTAMKLGEPLEIKRSPLPKCTKGKLRHQRQSCLSPLFSRGNDSGESSAAADTSQTARPPLAAPHPWSGWHPSPVHLLRDVISAWPCLILISLG